MSKKDNTEDVADIDFNVDKDVNAEAENQLDGVQITNHWRDALDICGVVIAAGDTSSVPDFDANQPLMAGWLKAKVISVSDA